MNGEQPAFPVVNTPYEGLSKREYFAGLAMQGILSAYSEALANGRMPDPSEYVKDCVIAADALLAELAKEQQP